MQVKDFLLFLPRGIVASVVKGVRTKPNEFTKEYISENGLYHFTKDEETLDKIITSGKIKKTNSLADSYGTPVTYMFAGIPELDNYLKNLVMTSKQNLLLNPNTILYAVKINPKESDIDKLKIRSFSDDAVLHKGNYNILDEQVQKKQLVLDLILDKNGEKKLVLREMTALEIEQNDYHISEECKKAVEQEKSRLGYLDSIPIYNSINTQIHLQKLESEFYSYRIKSSLNKIKNFFTKENNKIPALPSPCEDKSKIWRTNLKEDTKQAIEKQVNTPYIENTQIQSKIKEDDELTL